MVWIITGMFLFTLFISWMWVRGIDKMKRKHPDYKGEDFLNWDRKNDGWDDNKTHSEGDF